MAAEHITHNHKPHVLCKSSIRPEDCNRRRHRRQHRRRHRKKRQQRWRQRVPAVDVRRGRPDEQGRPLLHAVGRQGVHRADASRAADAEVLRRLDGVVLCRGRMRGGCVGRPEERAHRGLRHDRRRIPPRGDLETMDGVRRGARLSRPRRWFHLVRRTVRARQESRAGPIRVVAVSRCFFVGCHRVTLCIQRLLDSVLFLLLQGPRRFPSPIDRNGTTCASFGPSSA